MLPTPPEPMGDAVPLPRCDRPRVLWVDDVESNRKVLATTLTLNGYEVVALANGDEAIAWGQTHQPDLVLLDIQMPEPDGCAVARALRALPHLQTVPMVALTALALAEDHHRILAAGCNALLVKPVTLQTLLDTLEHWVPRGPCVNGHKHHPHYPNRGAEATRQSL